MQTTPELLPLWMEGLTPELVQRAEMELGESPEVKRKALAEFQRLIEDENGFVPMGDEVSLLRFLRFRKFNVPRAFQTLKNFYAYRSMYSGTLTDFSAIDLKPVLDMNTAIMLPKRDRNGCALFVVHVGVKDIDVVTVEQAIAFLFLIAETQMNTEASQVCGVRFVIDATDLTFSRSLHYCRPRYIACVVRSINDCAPIRIKGIHLVNAPSFINCSVNVVRRMLSSKLRNRFHLHHGDLESLYEFIPRENLPQSLGGVLGPKDYEEAVQDLIDRNHMSEKQKTYTFRGNVRPQPRNSSS